MKESELRMLKARVVVRYDTVSSFGKEKWVPFILWAVAEVGLLSSVTTHKH
ncbi:hypothetical protein COLO4_09054 [Corchorus olitorius]|uniref:Uncharacterized protein n=1 Tax=Corchorus olitorius TaxID=93759 RepID=A0A1R3KDD6_9ROSI|nr:hypothetical protein COLO4_09054 [Corchorus olitorius]